MEAFHTGNMTGQNNTGSRPNEPVKHFTATSLIGDKIFNAEGERLGRIKDIMLDVMEARIVYVVIASGGFGGLNQEYLAVPMQALRIAKEHHKAFILDETRESMKRYPAFDKDHWANTNLPDANATRLNEGGFMRTNKDI